MNTPEHKSLSPIEIRDSSPRERSMQTPVEMAHNHIKNDGGPDLSRREMRASNGDGPERPWNQLANKKTHRELWYEIGAAWLILLVPQVIGKFLGFTFWSPWVTPILFAWIAGRSVLGAMAAEDKTMGQRMMIQGILGYVFLFSERFVTFKAFLGSLFFLGGPVSATVGAIAALLIFWLAFDVVPPLVKESFFSGKNKK